SGRDAGTPQLHGKVNDLEKVGVSWPLVDIIEISPMTIIVWVGEASTGCKGSRYPHYAKQLADFGMPLLAVGVTNTVVTRAIPRIRVHYLQVIHVPSPGQLTIKIWPIRCWLVVFAGKRPEVLEQALRKLPWWVIERSLEPN